MASSSPTHVWSTLGRQSHEWLCWRALWLLAVGYMVYQFGLGVYRCMLDRKTKLMTAWALTCILLQYTSIHWPKSLGPKSQAYYDAWLGGKYFRVIDEMHAKYGHAVRINPDEVHFDDPESIDLLFPLGPRKTDKPWALHKRTGTPDSLVATIDHDTHRRRRAAISPFFSTARIRALDPIMKEHMGKMLGRMKRLAREEKIARMHYVIKACTSDIINTYAFGCSFGLLDREDFGQPYYEATDIFFALSHWFGQFTQLADVLHSLPPWLVALTVPPLKDMFDKKAFWINKLRQIRSSPDPDAFKRTIFEGVLGGKLKSEDKSDERLANEAQLIVFAGEGTTAYTLSAAVYEILAHPPVVRRLREELTQALPDVDVVPSFAQVDSLPYLGAVIQEVVRIHPGVMGRQVRISPEVPITYTDRRSDETYVLPAGTLTSMSPLTTHMNADVFEDPYEFVPQRWIDDPKIAASFIGFSRGSRSCVAMNFARKEMAVILATIFRQYDLYHGQEGKTLELYDTERRRDIDPVSDLIIPAPAKGSQGLRLRIRL